ncbi:MAG TPA: ABC transporter permease subunit [Tepidisphaeraceae bacterium]|jgi:NitT/TauT family transport system permease protein|nr:ABC transporter permease subunit [Tepidisphaeraceae bacterium]
MAWVIAYSDKVRQALKKPANVGIDALVILGVAGLIVAVASILGHTAEPRPSGVIINLSFWALPKYAFLSLSRAFIAYGLSLVFTLVYGTIIAHSRTAEKFLVPLLDVLQSLPVLAFLPGLVLLFVHLFPTSWLGLEIACVVMIFTAQAWNMTFSYYGSVRAIPDALREAAAIQHLSGWQIFRYLELPASMIGLVWNSMMSMAGGWFIITVDEAFTLNGVDYRLPGLGSYMNQAQNDWNIPAMVAGVVAMILVIVLCDQIVWRPIVVWSQRFKLEETATSEPAHSWVLQLLRRSRLLSFIERYWKRRHDTDAPRHGTKSDSAARASRRWLAAARWLVAAGLLALAAWGTLELAGLLIQLPFHQNGDQKGWTTVLLALLLSFGRTVAAVAIGAAWTLPAGILIGLSARWANRLQPVVQILASFPAPMIYLMLCVFMAKLSIPFTFGAIVLMLMGTQWYTLFNVIAGAMAIPSDLREAGRVYHLSIWQRWTRIYIPAVFPYLATGLITAAGGAWNATIVAEDISLPGKGGESTTYYAFGLGSLIDDATANGHFQLLAASVVTMALAVIIINRIFWKRLYRLAEGRYSLNV